jgi:hypothetical protein
MQTAITAEPTLTLPAGPPAELTYRLRVEDLVAYWVYLCRHARRLVPQAVIERLKWPWAMLPAFAAALVLVPMLVARGGVPGPRWGAWVLIAGTVGVLVLARLIRARPDLFVGGRPGLAFCRRLWLPQLAELAQEQADTGRLDTASAWRFSMTPEGFTFLTEREEVVAGVATVAGKRIQGPWAVLEHVGGTESHLFLTARDGTVFIVPHAAAPRGAFADLVATATRYHRAAVEGAPPATGITLRVEPVHAGPRLSQGVMRQEDRIVG